MARLLAIYWLIGCALIGGGLGLRAERCPLDRQPSTIEAMAFVAIWPSIITYMTFDTPPMRCAALAAAKAQP
jgi:hypothetical protein